MFAITGEVFGVFLVINNELCWKCFMVGAPNHDISLGALFPLSDTLDEKEKKSRTLHMRHLRYNVLKCVLHI